MDISEQLRRESTQYTFAAAAENRRSPKRPKWRRSLPIDPATGHLIDATLSVCQRLFDELIALRDELRVTIDNYHRHGPTINAARLSSDVFPRTTKMVSCVSDLMGQMSTRLSLHTETAEPLASLRRVHDSVRRETQLPLRGADVGHTIVQRWRDRVLHDLNTASSGAAAKLSCDAPSSVVTHTVPTVGNAGTQALVAGAPASLCQVDGVSACKTPRQMKVSALPTGRDEFQQMLKPTPRPHTSRLPRGPVPRVFEDMKKIEAVSSFVPRPPTANQAALRRQGPSIPR